MDSKVQAYIDQYGVTDETRIFLNSRHLMYINGEFVNSSDSATLTVIEPCTEGLIGEVPAATTEDINTAVAAANHAFHKGEWSQWKPAQREQVLHRIADLVEKNLQTLAEIESLDAGKAIEGCKAVDIIGSIDLLRYMAGWATKIDGATRPVSVDGEHFVYTLKEPLGVVGAIVPWNWPFNMAIWKLAAPLAVGCTVVLKPAQQTPLSVLYLAKLCQQAGLPKGALNIVTGKGSTVGNHLVQHPDIDKVSFTGSTEVGKIVGKAAIENLNHLTLELGGKSPMVVFEDADIGKVVDATQQSIFFNTGQVCSGGSRIYIHRSIYEPVLEAIARKANAMKIGATLDPSIAMGPAISASQKQTVVSYIQLGLDEGARLICGGKSVQGPGYFLEPTLLADCSNEMRVVQEEIFGPVLVAIPFDTNEEAIALANDNIYGLAASVFTQDISLAHRSVSQLKAGTVWVNTHDMIDVNMPFGGVKQSGFGKDLGPEQLEYFLETKSVWIAL